MPPFANSKFISHLRSYFIFESFGPIFLEISFSIHDAIFPYASFHNIFI